MAKLPRGLALVFGFSASQLLAQEVFELAPTTVTGAPDRPGAALQRPTETGSRLGVSAEQTPAAVEVVDRSAMDVRADRSAGEALEGVTGLTYGNPPADPSIFSFRGFSTNAITHLYDGIRVGPATMTSRPLDTFNLARIEVLRGPASTLYGEGAVGGAVNYVTKRPQRIPFTAEGVASYGRFDHLRLGVGLGGGIGQRLHYRVDLSEQNADTFVDRTKQRYFSLTSGLLWDVNEQFALEMDFDASSDDQSAYWGTPFVTNALPGAQPIDGILRDADGRFIDQRLRRENYNVDDNNVSSESKWTRLKADWSINKAWRLRNEFYRFDADRNWRNSEVYAFNPATLLVDRDRFFVSHDQEIKGNRLELSHRGRIGGRANLLLVGVDHSRLDFFRPSSFEGGDSVDPFDPVPGLYGTLVSAVRTTKLTTMALFAEDQFSVTDKLKLMLGLRAESIDLQREDFNSDGSPRADGIDRKFHPKSGRLGATFEALPGLTLYAQYATSADIASNTSNLFLIRAAQNFDLAKGRQFEIGLKQRFWDNRGVWTFAWYDIERRNLLSRTAVDVVSNVGKQSSDGIELAVALQPTAALRLSANYALTNAGYDRYRDTVSGAVYDGNTPPNVPKHVANLEAAYRLPATPLELGARVRHVGERTGNDANTLKLLSYTSLDASIAWIFKHARLSLHGRNLTNEDYVAWADVFYPTQVLLGAPRSYEIVLSARF